MIVLHAAAASAQADAAPKMGHARRKLCELLHTGEFFSASRSTGLWAAIPRDRAAATAERAAEIVEPAHRTLLRGPPRRKR